jgi:thiaminase/transcriptional activator TenA
VARVEAACPPSHKLLESCADTWAKAIGHPFVQQVADGSLPAASFHIWIQQDKRFVEGLTRFVAELIAIAPNDDVSGLESGLAALDPELELFRDYAEREGIRLDVVALPACDDYVEFLHACADDGYTHGLTAYYACERAYLDAWATVRDSSGLHAPYADWIANWTSEPFRVYVSWLGSRLDEQALGRSDPIDDDLREIFRRAVGFEIAFWDACFGV